MTALTIEPATVEDREWCARLMASTDPWVRLGRTVDDLRVRCADPLVQLWMARRDGAPCGFLRYDPRGVAGSPYIVSLAVAAEARSQGVGAALVAHAEQLAAGARYIFLLVSDFNPRARQLYERLGYVVTGHLPGFVINETGEYLMAKRLTSPCY